MAQPTFAQKIAAVAGLSLSPQNMAAPLRPGHPRTVVQPQSESPGNVAAAINATIPGDPRSPMDRVKIITRQRDALEGVGFPTEENVRLIGVALADYDLLSQVASPSEIDAMLAAEKRWNNLNGAMPAFTHSAARKAHQEHVASLAVKLAEGNASVGDDDAWNFEEFANDYQIKLAALKSEMHKIEVEAAAIAQPIRHRFFHAVNQLADILEGPGRSTAENFGVPYKPCNVVLMLRKAAAVAADPLTGTNGRPLGMVNFLPIAQNQ